MVSGDLLEVCHLVANGAVPSRLFLVHHQIVRGVEALKRCLLSLFTDTPCTYLQMIALLCPTRVFHARLANGTQERNAQPRHRHVIIWIQLWFDDLDRFLARHVVCSDAAQYFSGGDLFRQLAANAPVLVRPFLLPTRLEFDIHVRNARFVTSGDQRPNLNTII